MLSHARNAGRGVGAVCQNGRPLNARDSLFGSLAAGLTLGLD